MSHHFGLQVLRAKIRGFQVTGSSITARIAKSHKERKHRLWNKKRELGTQCRYHHVAYGLLRGVPYLSIERCAPNNRLDPQKLLDVMLQHADFSQKRSLTLESVKEMLTPPTATASTATIVGTRVSEQTPESRSRSALGWARRLLEKRA